MSLLLPGCAAVGLPIFVPGPQELVPGFLMKCHEAEPHGNLGGIQLSLSSRVAPSFAVPIPLGSDGPVNGPWSE